MNSDTLYISPDADHEEAFYRDMANRNRQSQSRTINKGC